MIIGIVKSKSENIASVNNFGESGDSTCDGSANRRSISGVLLN